MSAPKLPAGWGIVKFGDVVRKLNDRVDPNTAGLERYVAGEHMDTDSLKIRRWGVVGDGYLGPAFTMRFSPSHVLYGSRRTYLRKVAQADFEGICANTTFVLAPKSDELSPAYLPHLMSTENFHSFSTSKSKGSVNPYINFSDLVDYEFALPPPSEQKKVVDVISAFDETLEGYRNLPIDVQRQSMLHELLNAGGDGWCRHEFSKDIVLVKGRLPKSKNQAGLGVPYLSAKYLRTGVIEFWTEDLSDVVLSSPGDCLLLWDGEGAGDIFCSPGGAVSSTMALITPKNDAISPEFLILFLSAEENYLKESSRGTAVPHVSAYAIANIKLIFPPLKKQQRIVKIVSSLDRVRESVHAATKNLNQTRNRVLNELLTQGFKHV